MAQSALYESDFHAWAKEQAALLRAGKLAQADIRLSVVFRPDDGFGLLARFRIGCAAQPRRTRQFDACTRARSPWGGRISRSANLAR